MTVATQHTLESHLAAEIQDASELGADLAAVLGALAQAGEKLSRQIGRAALSGEVGVSGAQNPTGDCQNNWTCWATKSSSRSCRNQGSSRR